MRVVSMWSFFTVATGWAWNLGSLVVCRFLFGAGEAGCFPNLTKAFTFWFPVAERVRAQGVLWLSAVGRSFYPDCRRWMLASGGENRRASVSITSGCFSFSACSGSDGAALFYRWFRNHRKTIPP